MVPALKPLAALFLLFLMRAPQWGSTKQGMGDPPLILLD
jgi:hypothetical protein